MERLYFSNVYSRDSVNELVQYEYMPRIVFDDTKYLFEYREVFLRDRKKSDPSLCIKIS